MNETTAQTSLFSSSTPSTADQPAERTRRFVSPRAAFQYALYARGLLLDARRNRQEGLIDPSLATITDRSGGDWNQHLRTLVLADSDEAASRIAARLRRVLPGEVSAIEGGFAAWQEARLPTLATYRASTPPDANQQDLPNDPHS